MLWTLTKRVTLFCFVNALIVVTISLLLNVLGVRPYLTAKGIDYQSLLIFCLAWGIGGAFISLALSKTIAKWTMGVKIIDPETIDPRMRRILQSVYHSAEKAGLTVMPEVGVYASPEVNAFATGPTRAKALVAVSSGLFQKLSPEEMDGVIAHEVAHIANGDMVTMTLIQGIVNAFVMFLARVLAFAFMFSSRSRDEEDRGSPFVHYLLVSVIEVVLLFFGMLIVAYVSRRREYRADAGGAELAGRGKMLAALHALHRTHRLVDPRPQTPAVQTLKIANPAGGARFLRLFATHPPLAERIIRVQGLPRE